MEILDWRFIFVIITFAVIGFVCIINKSKIGLTASSFGVIATLVAWCGVKINIKVKSMLEQVGLTFKDIFTFIITILATILAFILIFFFIKIFGGNKILKKR